MLVNTFSVLKQLRHCNGDLLTKGAKLCVCLWKFDHRRGMSARKKAFHISDKSVADMVIKEMGINDDTKSIPVLEAFPGSGILTEKLLMETPANQIFGFEPRPEYMPHLEALKSKYQSRYTVVNQDLFQLTRFYQSPHYLKNPKALDTLFNIPSKDWKEIAIKFVGYLQPSREATYLRFLVNLLPSFDSIYSIGRCEFYFFISEKELKYLLSKPKERFSLYLTVSVLCQLYFDVKLIAKVPNSAFTPKITRFQMKVNQYDRTVSCFVKITPKADLDSIVPIKQLPELSYFVKQNMANRNMTVVPALEKWIPNSGPRIIKEGVSIFTKFGDLSPTEILNIFQHFSSWPEYTYSAFQDNVANQVLDYYVDDEAPSINDEPDSLDDNDELTPGL